MMTDHKNEKGSTEEFVDPKSGLRKVFKAAFDAEPERYELRANDAAVPACPYGNRYAWIGYDRRRNEYVRLVKSILKDNRLKKIVY